MFASFSCVLVGQYLQRPIRPTGNCKPALVLLDVVCFLSPRPPLPFPFPDPLPVIVDARAREERRETMCERTLHTKNVEDIAAGHRDDTRRLGRYHDWSVSSCYNQQKQLRHGELTFARHDYIVVWLKSCIIVSFARCCPSWIVMLGRRLGQRTSFSSSHAVAQVLSRHDLRKPTKGRRSFVIQVESCATNYPTVAWRTRLYTEV